MYMYMLKIADVDAKNSQSPSLHTHGVCPTLFNATWWQLIVELKVAIADNSYKWLFTN